MTRTKSCKIVLIYSVISKKIKIKINAKNKEIENVENRKKRGKNTKQIKNFDTAINRRVSFWEYKMLPVVDIS